LLDAKIISPDRERARALTFVLRRVSLKHFA
jgi:hypothetical protein